MNKNDCSYFNQMILQLPLMVLRCFFFHMMSLTSCKQCDMGGHKVQCTEGFATLPEKLHCVSTPLHDLVGPLFNLTNSSQNTFFMLLVLPRKP